VSWVSQGSNTGLSVTTPPKDLTLVLKVKLKFFCGTEPIGTLPVHVVTLARLTLFFPTLFYLVTGVV